MRCSILLHCLLAIVTQAAPGPGHSRRHDHGTSREESTYISDPTTITHPIEVSNVGSIECLGCRKRTDNSRRTLQKRGVPDVNLPYGAWIVLASFAVIGLFGTIGGVLFLLWKVLIGPYLTRRRGARLPPPPLREPSVYGTGSRRVDPAPLGPALSMVSRDASSATVGLSARSAVGSSAEPIARPLARTSNVVAEPAMQTVGGETTRQLQGAHAGAGDAVHAAALSGTLSETSSIAERPGAVVGTPRR